MKNKLVKLVKVLTNVMVEQDSRGWPPECILITYQPERPVKQVKEEADS